MRKLLLAVWTLLCMAQASAQFIPNSIRVSQRLPDNSGYINRDLIPPADGKDGLFLYNGTTLLPGYVTLGTGLSVTSGVLNSASQVNADWNATSGPAQIQNKPIISMVGMTGQYGDLLGKPTAVSSFTNDAGYIDSTGLNTALSGYATNNALNTGLAGKDALGSAAAAQAFSIQRANHTGTQPASTITGLATVATSGSYNDLSNKPTIPTVTQFNFGSPNARTLAVSTAYQATDPTKAAVVTVSPQCSATITLSSGSTCTMQARIGASGLTCSTGTVVAQWTNGNTGTLTVGLNLTQIIGGPGDIKLPIGGWFILCPTAGTFTINSAVDQSAG